MASKKNTENKITPEWLNKINDQQRGLNMLLNNIGVLESQKHSLLHQLGELNKEIEDTKTELEGIYGSVNINLQDGTYTPIEEAK
jgi:hypothetical protein